MKRTADLTVNFCGVKFNNPLVLASGFLGISVASLKFVEKSGAGGLTTKSIGHQERKGHTPPIVFPWGAGLINAVGLSNQGIEESLPMLCEMIKKIKPPLIISIFADTTENYAAVTRKVALLKPQFIEVNASCPNTENDYGTPFALDKEALQNLTRAVKKVIGKTKMIVKLAQNVPNIALMGKIVESEGADAVNAINTVPGMVIDIYTRKPILTNKVGGISGKAIRPLAVKAVYDLYRTVRIPIIGTGGVETGEDGLEMIMAGASLVGVGSAIYFKGINVFKKISLEMQQIMRKEGIKNLSEVKGATHG